MSYPGKAIITYYANTVATSLPTGTNTAVNFDTIDYNNTIGNATIGLTISSGNTFTNTSGYGMIVYVSYFVTISVPNTTGMRYSSILKNGSYVYGNAEQSTYSASADYIRNNGSCCIYLLPNDYLQIRYWQNSGTTMSLQTGYNNNSLTFCVL